MLKPIVLEIDITISLGVENPNDTEIRAKLDIPKKAKRRAPTNPFTIWCAGILFVFSFTLYSFADCLVVRTRFRTMNEISDSTIK